jgi:xanthine dehydrogenase YagR molybdenum-binding subunit
MPDYKWPEPAKRTLMGKRISRLDGPDKVSGKAKYTYDVKRPEMLYGKILRSPHAHAKIVSIDTSAAEKMPGVKAVKIIDPVGTEMHYAGWEIAAVAATEEHLAEDAARAIKVVYEQLPHVVREEDLSKVGDRAKPAAEKVEGDPDKAFREAEVVVEGNYSLPVITHCCLEPHGQITEWEGEDKLLVHASTQAVSSLAQQFADPLKLQATNVQIKMDHVGGGFGSKFNPDRWGLEGVRLSKLAGGKPVKIMLERDAELMVAGTRPSTFAKVKVGAKKDGTVTAWESTSWGTGGMTGAGMPPLPYVWAIPNVRANHSAVQTNMGAQRAWRAPNHPQACFVTMAAMEDLAAQLKMDPLELFLKNINILGPRNAPFSGFYQEELLKAAELIEWKKKWHPRGDPTTGHIKKGLGLSLHTWGGRPHDSDCQLTINPDGSVAIHMGTQDLGTGTRTVLAIVAADTLGLPLDAIKVNIGDSKYPKSGNSGGSTTVGGVSSSTRRAAVDALDALFKQVAPAMNADPAKLEAVGGKIQVQGDPAKSITWKQACSRLGVTPISVLGKQPDTTKGVLANSGVAGVQMAEVSVDIETGVAKIEKLVAVQDVGYIIDLKTAESQTYGALIMGVCWALYEEKIMDRLTGLTLNPNMEFYKLAGIGDIGTLVVHMMTGAAQDERGVIGLGEPPAVSPGAAIANAVANAIGVRVPSLPLTPDRILAALEKKGGLT